jgi:hypothetical protein
VEHFVVTYQFGAALLSLNLALGKIELNMMHVRTYGHFCRNDFPYENFHRHFAEKGAIPLTFSMIFHCQSHDHVDRGQFNAMKDLHIFTEAFKMSS